MSKKKPNYNDKIMNEKSFTAREMAHEIRWAFQRGVKLAAGVANDYNSSTTHPYMLGDCILAKLNQIGKAKVRKNVDRIERSKVTAGERVKYLRATKNLTQLKLAERADMTQPNIASIECGKRVVGMKTARKLGKALAVDYRVFL